MDERDLQGELHKLLARIDLLGARMQRLPFADFKTVVYKLFVFCINRSFHNSISAIKIVVEKGMPDVFHVYANLVRPACF